MFRKIITSFRVLLVLTVLIPFQIFGQNSKTEKDTNDCVIIMEVNSVKYCLSSVSYSNSVSELAADIQDSKIITPAKVDMIFYVTFSMNNKDVSQYLIDWAIVNPTKRQSIVIKFYNQTKTKVLKELKMEEAYISSFNSTEDTYSTGLQGNYYSLTSFSLNCKKFELKLQ